jgi:RNase P subunit RPR2
MSYKTREKKRRRNIAIANARPKPDRHYLTIVRRAGCCNACGHSLRPGSECVYRFEPREILCKDCADGAGIQYRPSKSWEKRNSKRRQGRLVAVARKAA